MNVVFPGDLALIDTSAAVATLLWSLGAATLALLAMMSLLKRNAPKRVPLRVEQPMADSFSRCEAVPSVRGDVDPDCGPTRAPPGSLRTLQPVRREALDRPAD